jgi:hypothetical protein
VAGGAPAVLRSRIANVTHRSNDGYVAELRDGPQLIFGPATRLRAKWAAAARVLADLEARGASYVDLRIPDRPAVGGLAATTLTPVAPAPPALTAPADSTAGAVTPASAQSAVPNSTPTDTSATPTAPPADTTPPAAPQVPTGTAQPPAGGSGGGATAAP